VRWDRRGVEAVYDAILFFTIMMLATAGMLVYGVQARGVAEVEGYGEMQEYCQTTYSALLGSTIPYVECSDASGQVIAFRNWSVRELLTFDMTEKARGRWNTGLAPLEDAITAQASNLIRTGMNFALYARHELTSTAIIISGDTALQSLQDIPEGDVAASSWSGPVAGLTGNVEIGLKMWR